MFAARFIVRTISVAFAGILAFVPVAQAQSPKIKVEIGVIFVEYTDGQQKVLRTLQSSRREDIPKLEEGGAWDLVA